MDESVGMRRADGAVEKQPLVDAPPLTRPHETKRASELRMLEAAALDNVRLFVVACPKDVTMFRDAVKTSGLEQRIVVKDLIELVYEALFTD